MNDSIFCFTGDINYEKNNIVIVISLYNDFYYLRHDYLCPGGDL